MTMSGRSVRDHDWCVWIYEAGVIFNDYSPKAKFNIVRLGDYSTISTEPEGNNCFSIFTRSDLNRIRKETIKKRVV